MNQLKPIKPGAGGRTTVDSSSAVAGALLLGWKMDVTAARDIEQVDAVSANQNQQYSGRSAETDVESAAPKPKVRGLNRLAPKKDEQSAQRRERLQKLRRVNRLTPAAAVAVDSDQKLSESKNRLISASPYKTAKLSPSVKVGSRKPVAVDSTKESDSESDVVHSVVVAEIASLASKKIGSRTAGHFQATDTVQLSSKSDVKRKPKTEAVADVVAKPVTAKNARVKSKSLVFTVKEPAPVEQELYLDWFRRVILKHRWMSLVTTCYVHWLLILALAALLVNGPEDTVNMLLNASFASEEMPEEATFEVAVPEPAPMETVEETKPEMADAAPSTLSESQVELEESVLDSLSPVADAAASEPAAAASDVAAESPSSNPAVDRSPPQAVKKGSFSVWTEPSSPQAGEPYRIIIQICLPNGLKKYNVADLEGVVVGSDGYRKPIPGFLRGFLPVEDGYARLIVPIVTADENVQDTIFIRSRILKETQKLHLEFESSL